MILAALALTAATATPSPLTDPYAILADARSYWQAQRYPAKVDYTIHTQAMDRGRLEERHYTARWYADTGDIAIDPISAEEAAHPYVPGGGFNFGPFSIGGPHDGGGVKGDLLALPVLAPNYAFGIAPYLPPAAATPDQLVAEIRERFHDPAPEKVARLAALHGPRVIATVTADRHDYAVALLGIEPYAGHADYHLRLQPTHDPGRLRLRELWIDARTFATDRLVTQGNFSRGPSLRVPWDVTFADVGSARYVSSESAMLSLKTGFRSSLQDYRVTFEAIVPGTGRFWGGDPFGTARLVEPL